MDRTSASSLISVLLCVAGLGIAHVISFRWHYLGLATFGMRPPREVYPEFCFHGDGPVEACVGDSAVHYCRP